VACKLSVVGAGETWYCSAALQLKEVETVGDMNLSELKIEYSIVRNQDGKKNHEHLQYPYASPSGFLIIEPQPRRTGARVRSTDVSMAGVCTGQPSIMPRSRHWALK
jgi:hypothetical protein